MLEEEHVNLMNPNTIFMHDDAPIHTARAKGQELFTGDGISNAKLAPVFSRPKPHRKYVETS